MSAVFGPVLSRRLGRSLGIDPLIPKRCNYNCVYCQLGRTLPLVSGRQEHVPTADIVSQLKDVLKRATPGSIDWVTFVGSGETTLHAGLGTVIREVKALTSLPVAVLTNGSLLHRPEIRRELHAVDAVLPSLDVGTAELFRRIARPHPQCTFERLLEGLVAFRREYSGKLWLEVMLVSGLNDSEEALRDIAVTAWQVAPDEIHINVPSRPPAEDWVRPPGEEGLERAAAILGRVARIIPPVEGTIESSAVANTVEAVMSIITRHPMQQAELEQCLADRGQAAIADALAELEGSGRAYEVERDGYRFWRAATQSRPNGSPPWRGKFR